MPDTAQWRKTLLNLPDSSFFEIMRNYLGEVHTPFNKQSLLDRLQNFLSRASTQDAVLAAMDTDDARFLSAVELLEHPTRTELLDFLSTEYTRLEVENRVLNLQDRLLVYPEIDTERLYLNPILEPVLSERVVGRHLLFPSVPLEEPTAAEPWLTDTLLSAVFSLLIEEPLSFRADGRLKKRSEKRLGETVDFLTREDGYHLAVLRAALTELGLAAEHGTELHPVLDAWRDIAALSRRGRLATVWAAAAGSSALACALRAAFASLEPGYAVRGYHLLQLIRIAAPRCTAAAGRIESPHRRPLESTTDETLLERLCGLGVIEDRGENYYAPTEEALERMREPTEPRESRTSGVGQRQAEHGQAEHGRAEDDLEGQRQAEHGRAGQPPAVITPSYQMTLTPAASLSEALPAVGAAHLVRYDRYCEYEINRDSVVRAFRAGFEAKEIQTSLETLHGGSLPQNVRFSVDTWKDEYERVELLDGVVLLVEESHAPMVEHSPGLSPYLRRRLGPGAFLLSREEEHEWRAALERSGLGAVPATKPVETARTPELRARRFEEPAEVALPAQAPAEARGEGPGSAEEAGVETAAESHRSGSAVEERLTAVAEQAGLSQEQVQEVQRRIERRLILVPEQISRALVPREMPEARGLDYVGKVRLVEQALSRGTDYLEVIERGGGGPSRLFIRPVRLDKRSSNLVLHGETVGEGKEVSVRVDKMALVRVVSGKLFVR